MNPDLVKVIPAIVANIAKSGGYVTKTKLLKLLYLFDIEYYRAHHETFTGFNWIYYELGPWTQEYYNLLDQVERDEALIAYPSAKPDYDTKFYKAREFVDIFGLLDNHSDEGLLRTVLNAWGNKTTAEILEYVYFETEPMLSGQRYQPLDFSLVSPEVPVKYSIRPSEKTPEQIRKLKAEFKNRRAATPKEDERKLTTQPKYDQAFFDLLADLEKDH